jgi:streptomycin 3"-adenylyltransferase
LGFKPFLGALGKTVPVSEVPALAQRQIDELVAGLRALLGSALIGVYVHGSLALGCFNARRSDLDVIAVCSRPTSKDERVLLADLLERVSAPPRPHELGDAPSRRPLEFHLLLTDDLRPWRFPPSFEAKSWSGRGLLERRPDPDLAAHFDVLRASGITIVGPPPRDLFPPVPRADLERALRSDLTWTRTESRELYAILSPVRVWAAIATGEVHSKASGAHWALERLPPGLRATVAHALSLYEGENLDFEHDPTAVQRLCDFVEEQIGT